VPTQVGKSTVAANLALALSQLDKQTALLDADVYGPSVPTIMGLYGRRAFANENKLLEPLTNYNVRCMSMGFLVPEDTAMIWRGPMVLIDIVARNVFTKIGTNYYDAKFN